MTSSCSEVDLRSPTVEVAVLKSWDSSAWRREEGNGDHLPYRMDHLEERGFRLLWSDTVQAGGWQESATGRVVRTAERLTVPFLQTCLMARRIRAAPITLAMFESEANALAVARRVRPGTSPGIFAVISCWLSELAASGRLRRAEYRWAYRSVDRLYYLSRNQGPLLADLLGIGQDRMRYLPFGVDHETFTPSSEPDGGYVLVVGRDRGRDWPTTLTALDGIGIPTKVCCRPGDLAGCRVPAGVEVLGYVGRATYRALLSAARVVAIAARRVSYPSGQSVLLEAMATGRAVAVTLTEPLADYVDDGVNALGVPPGDPDALREAVIRLAGDDELRRKVGAGGRAAVERTFNARQMWGTVAEDLWTLNG